ncbi:MAG: oligosaccharide flippase family protein, partial [Bacteroidota bacterium]
MGVLKKLAGQTVIYGLSTIISRLLNLFFTPFYTDVFPKGVYGIYTNLYANMAFANVILTFGMETTFFRFLQDNKDVKKVYNQAFFWILLLVGGFFLIGLLLNEQIASLLGYEGEGSLILLLIGIIGLDALSALPLAKLRYEEKVLRFAAINVTNVIITIILNIIFIYFLELGINYVFVANLIASAARFLMALWGNLPTSLRPELALLREMIDYAFFMMIAGLAGIMNETLDRAYMPRWWGDEAKDFQGELLTGTEMVGVYGASYKVAGLIYLATQAFRYAVEPFFFKQAGEKNSPQTFARIFHYFIIASLTGFLLVGSFRFEIVSFNFFGIPNALGMGTKTFVNEAYWSGIVVIPILLLAYVFNGAYINMSIWFKITKQTRMAIWFTGTGALITILINYFGIPVYGYMASAWATLICYVVMSIM